MTTLVVFGAKKKKKKKKLHEMQKIKQTKTKKKQALLMAIIFSLNFCLYITMHKRQQHIATKGDLFTQHCYSLFFLLSPGVFFFKLWGYCERHRLSVRPSWFSPKPVGEIQTNLLHHFPSWRGGARATLFFLASVRPSVVRPFVGHIISLTTGWNLSKPATSLPLMVK